MSSYGSTLLWLFLAVFALFQPGYIQPDEFFQNPEITAGEIFNVTHFRAWEFEEKNALRTIFFPYFSTGILLFIARHLAIFFNVKLSAELLLIIPRIGFCLLIPVLDRILQDLDASLGEDLDAGRGKDRDVDPGRDLDLSSGQDRNVDPGRDPDLSSGQDLDLGLRGRHFGGRHLGGPRSEGPKMVFRTSYLTFVLLSRTFSNSLEVTFFAILLNLILRKSSGKFSGNFGSVLIGFFSALGVFNRPTFLAFGLVPWLFMLCTFKIRKIIYCAASGILTSLILIGIDSWYYGRFVLTPFQFIFYNLNPKNNEIHGLHPRYFHLFVSLPQLFGPIWLSLLTSSTRATLCKEKFLVASFFFPLFFISLIPHQEPRFLLPLLVPLFLLFGKSTWQNRKIRSFWLIFNLLMGVAFGVFHQGGLTQSLISIRTILEKNQNEKNSQFFFFKTYLPPRYPLLLAHNQSDRIVDLGLEKLELKDLATQMSFWKTEEKFLVAPATIPILQIFSSATLFDRFCPHWSFEAQPDYKLLFRHPELLCLNLWKLHSEEKK